MTILMSALSPKVAMILLNLNGYCDTRDCLESLARLQYSNFEVIVVDNGSRDDSVLQLRANFPDVLTLHSTVNLGFTGGNNLAIAHALQRGADYVLLLNNDTLVDPGFLESLVKVAETDRRIGVIGPKILYASEPRRIWYAGGSVRYGMCRHLGRNEVDQSGDRSGAVDTGFVSGCAMLIRAQVLREIGLLDNRLFVYHEDTEFCLRARAAGYRCMYVAQARIWHKVSRTCGPESPFTLYLCTRNELALAARYTRFPMKFAVLSFLLGKKLAKALLLRLRNRGPAATAVARGLRAFLFGVYGPPPSGAPEQNRSVLMSLTAPASPTEAEVER